jgi:pyruvate formate lyase activating enzyme
MTAIPDHLTQEGYLYSKLPENKVRCVACGHQCVIHEGQQGICGARFNKDGILRVPSNYVAAYRIHPVETNVIFHVKPGSKALIFGMFGCDHHCPYCHNWEISQVFREQRNPSPQEISASEIVQKAIDSDCSVIASAYNEPLISAEWAAEIFQIAKSQGLTTAFVTDGNATPECMQYLRPHLDVFRVDLKAWKPEDYRTLGAQRDSILNSIQLAFELGFWVEVVTLIVPYFNDNISDLRSIAKFISSLSKNIPWHVTAFHPRYKMQDRSTTPMQIITLAAMEGYASGLNYVYTGNAPGTNFENTYCSECKSLLVERSGYEILQNHLNFGSCSFCKTPIAGLW